MEYIGLYNFYYNELVEEINLMAKEGRRATGGISVTVINETIVDTPVYRYHVLMEKNI